MSTLRVPGLRHHVHVDDEPASTGPARIVRAVPRLFIMAAAFVGMLVADGVLFWVFLVILTAAVVSVLPLVSSTRQRVDKGRGSQPKLVFPPPGGAGPSALGGDRCVLLEVVGPKKIQVVKVVREINGMRLAEAKALVDNAPSVVAVGLSDHDARRVQAMLLAAGATARVDQALQPPRDLGGGIT